jgi:hypothetical protein
MYKRQKYENYQKEWHLAIKPLAFALASLPSPIDKGGLSENRTSPIDDTNIYISDYRIYLPCIPATANIGRNNYLLSSPFHSPFLSGVYSILQS